MAAWVLHTYCFTAFRHPPRLAFTSPEKRCGKTTALDVLALLACRALSTANITSAALFRTIEKASPTLLIDEADTFLGNNDDLRGAINAGHKRDGQVIRCVGDDAEPRAFSVFSPAVIAAIGRLPGTIEDRSIMVRMRRATRAERPVSLDRSAETEAGRLARMCVRWAADHGKHLQEANPTLPAALFNRAADNWRALFAIAEQAGGGWWKRIEASSAVLMPEDDAEGRGVRLLADIKAVFDKANVDRFGSGELVKSLLEIEDSPWPDLGRGKPLTQNKMAGLLKQYSIRPHNVRLSTDETPKGYERSDFDDAWKRYLDEALSKPPHRHNPTESGTFARHDPPQSDGVVAVWETEKPRTSAACGGVAVQTEEAGGFV
jgi:hypothetical protein